MTSLDHVLQMMEDAARWHEVEPSRLTASQLRRYAKETDKEPIPPETFTALGGFRNVRDANFPPQPDLAAIKKEELSYVATKARRQARDAAREGLFAQKVEELVAQYFSGRIVPSEMAKVKHKITPRRALNVVLSDLHFGSSFDEAEVGVSYGRTEEARRLAYVAKQVISYKEDYRDDTVLNVFLLGDIIENNLHDPRAADELAKQVCIAVDLLSQFVSVVSQHFKQVKVYCTPGNHGRYFYRTKGKRQTNQKWDSHETTIYFSVMNAAKDLKNVEFVIPKTPFVEFEVFGMRGFATHGDSHFNPGMPGKTIQVASFEEYINRLNVTLPDKQKYWAVVCGHVHTASLTFLNNGAAVLTNGSMVPGGEFVQSIGIPATRSYQLMWESVPGHMVGDFRVISLDGGVDRDRSLDKLIKPFTFF